MQWVLVRISVLPWVDLAFRLCHFWSTRSQGCTFLVLAHCKLPELLAHSMKNRVLTIGDGGSGYLDRVGYMQLSQDARWRRVDLVLA